MALSVTVGDETITLVPGSGEQTLFLREQIADSPVWQAIAMNPLQKWSEVETAIENPETLDRENALNWIVLERLDGVGVGDKPGSEKARCFIRPIDEEVTEWAAVGSWDVSGLLLLTFDIPEPLEYRSPEKIPLAFADFWNKVDSIKNNLMNPLNYGVERITNPIIRRVVLPGLIDPIENQGRHIRSVSYSVRADGAVG